MIHIWIESQSYSHNNVEGMHMVGSKILGFIGYIGPICLDAFPEYIIIYTKLFHKTQPIFPVAV